MTPVFGFRTERVEQAADGRLTLVSDDGKRVEGVDEVVVVTGFRPDLSWLSEVRLDLDPALQSPRDLAPLIDPNVHSRGTVYPRGAAELAQPEPGLYLAGMKSYGRAPTFLARTGTSRSAPAAPVCSTPTPPLRRPPSGAAAARPRPTPNARNRPGRADPQRDRRAGPRSGAGTQRSAGPPELTSAARWRVLVVLCVTEIASWGEHPTELLDEVGGDPREMPIGRQQPH